MKLFKNVFLVTIFISILISIFGNVEARDVTYNRNAALRYAEQYCGAEGSGTAYNFSQYKCWNVDLEECRKDNPQNTGRVDCANFVSQALIEGGLDFNDSKGAVTIGKGEKAGKKGHPLVKNLLSALLMQNCFEIITDPSKAQPGDILSVYKGDVHKNIS